MRLTDDQRADRVMSESALKEQVLAIARANGWKVFHLTHDRRGRSTAKGSGYPDLTCAKVVGFPRVVFIELKRETEDLDPDQVEWAAALGGSSTGSYDPVRWYVIRPSDLRAGRVDWVFATKGIT